MTRPLSSFVPRVLRRARGSRRGSVILLAVGVLGIISIAALSYVTIVRLDRVSAEAAATRENFQKQVGEVVSHIGELITADLFGGKIVTDAVPQNPDPTDKFRWLPEMFEDGDTRDIPTVDMRSFRIPEQASLSSSFPNGPVLDRLNENFGVQRRFKVGPADDAWLASNAPRWEPNPAFTRIWPQITNLRDGFYFDEGNPGDTSDDRWVRRDGRFVDLGQWFIKGVNNFGNAGIDLLSWTDNNTSDDGRLGPQDAVEQEVFHRAVNVMAYETDPVPNDSVDSGVIDPISPRDERQWVDTDGDLRPDARWTQLERLGRRFGLEWVVAARIIDLSAYINVNSAAGMTPNLGGLQAPNVLGGGRTPAEVDIRRFLERAANSNWNQGITGAPGRRITNQNLQFALREHLGNTGTDFVLGNMQDLAQADAFSPFFPFRPGNTALPPPGNPELDWRQRDSWWIGAGANARFPTVDGAYPIPDSSMVDLFTFWSTNHSGIVSPVETAFDGPEGSPLLPSIDVAAEDYGPMRSRELPAEARRFQNGDREPVPTARQIRDSARAYLTTINGHGQFSPVPVLNRRDNRYYREQVRQKVNLALGPMAFQASSVTGEAADWSDVQRTFESLVWALAPLATDQPLNRELAEAPMGPGIGYDNPSVDAHYGGGASGPARHMNFAGPTINPAFALDTGSNFAVAVAAMMTANIRDAVDRDDEPTIILLGNDDTLQGEHPTQGSAKVRDDPASNNQVFELGMSLAHGWVRTAQTQGGGAGTLFAPLGLATDRNNMMLVAGQDRQPFIVEATTMTFYSNEPVDGAGAPSSDGTIKEGDAIGSAIVVQISNPWWGSIVLDDSYRLALVVPGGALDGTGDRVRLDFPDGEVITIPATGSHTFYWVYDGTGVITLRNEIIDRIEAVASGGGNDVATEIVYSPENGPLTPVPFAQYPSASVVLYREIPIEIDDGGVVEESFELIVDRMSPDPTGTTDPFPMTIANATGGGFSPGVLTLASAPGGADQVQGFSGAYFTGLGYDVNNMMDTRFISGQPDPARIRGRIGLSSNLSRSGVRGSAVGTDDAGTVLTGSESGFPAFVLEVPARNSVKVRRAGHAWMDPDPMFDGTATTARAFPDAIVNGGDLDRLHLEPYDPDFSVWQLDNLVKPFNGAWTARDIWSFQLYVPDNQNGAPHLNALSELHLISCYATTCLQWSARANTAAWSTFTEKLGQSVRYDHDPASGATTPNPYLGVLDPSRFILSDGLQMAAISGLPDSLRIPLALRVFDCFETLPVSGPLVQGRVNINTAPEPVLRALPFMDVRSDILARAGSLQAGDDRISLLQSYRQADPRPGDSFVNNERNQVLPGLPGLRPGIQGAIKFNEDQRLPVPSVGFHSTGELALIDDWNYLTGSPKQDAGGFGSGSQIFGFLEVAAEASTGAATQERRPLELIDEYPTDDNDPANDPEERLAIYRALSNIVTTRSDVFLAWFVLRGYDPQAIELIPVSGSADQRLQAMDDERYNFGPVYESRWLAVFDRSNVKRPTDRARVVMLLEIPKATP